MHLQQQPSALFTTDTEMKLQSFVILLLILLTAVSSATATERIRVFSSHNLKVDEEATVFLQTYDSFKDYDEYNSKRESKNISYISGFFGDLGIGYTESFYRDKFSYNVGMQDTVIEQNIDARFYEIYYMFGNTFTFQIGAGYTGGSIPNGREIRSDYTSPPKNYDLQAEGFTVIGNLGLKLWRVELLVGYRKEVLKVEHSSLEPSGNIGFENGVKITSFQSYGLGFTF